MHRIRMHLCRKPCIRCWADQETKLPLRAIFRSSFPFALGKGKSWFSRSFSKPLSVLCTPSCFPYYSSYRCCSHEEWSEWFLLTSAWPRRIAPGQGGGRRVLCRSFLCSLCPPNWKWPILVDCLWHFPDFHWEVSSPPYLELKQQLMSGPLIIL